MSDKPDCFETSLCGAEPDCLGDPNTSACLDCARYLDLNDEDEEEA